MIAYAFKIDENLSTDVAVRLRELGYDADDVFDDRLNGQPDEPIAAVCQRERRCLITLDLDFADVRRYPPSEYHGIIVLRPKDQGWSYVLNLIDRLVALFDIHPLAGRLWIVDDSNVRVRA